MTRYIFILSLPIVGVCSQNSKLREGRDDFVFLFFVVVHCCLARP